MKKLLRASLVVAAAAWMAGSGRAADKPNVVIIMADDMGYGDVQALNPASTIPTPHIDSLAREGVTFLDGHSPSAVCTPTRYGLLTGRYAWRTRLKRGVLGGYSKPLLGPDRPTIGTLLQGQGYRTAAVGKWHLGMTMPMKDGEGDVTRWAGDPGVDFKGRITDSPVDHGFDEYFGVSASLDMAPYVYIRNDRFVSVPTLQQEAVKFPHFIRAGPRSEDFVVEEVLDRLTQEATAFIRREAAKEGPFFLYLPLTAPHKPTQPHARFRGRTGLGEYGDFILQVDWTVGQVLKALEETGVANHSLVVFTSDNGSYMYRFDDPKRKDHVEDASVQGYRADRHRANGPFRGTKADIWEGGHHVPLLMRWPARLKAGRRVRATVCLTDLYATCADVAGGEVGTEAGEDSVSLLDLMRGEAQQRGVPVVHHSAAGMFSLRDERWKLVAGNGSGGRERPRGRPFERPFQLFDMSRDMEERHDVATEHPEVVARLSEQLERLRQADRSVPR